MNCLIIDTSTERGFIALFRPDKQPLIHFLPVGLNQSKTLMVDLQNLLSPFQKDVLNLDAIAVTIGPGSYTGIRIGVAVAQALAYAWQCPLIGLATLHGFIPSVNGNYLAVIDARIGGFYVLKGKLEDKQCEYEGTGVVVSLEEAYQLLESCPYIVTPNAHLLKNKLKGNWQWEETYPSAHMHYQNAKKLFEEKKVCYPPQTLELLYLRETEAERQKKNSCKTICSDIKKN